MDSMHSTSSKTRNPVTHLQKAFITSAMASSQVVEWYLRQIEGLHLKRFGSLSGRKRITEEPYNGKPVRCFLVGRV